MSPVHPISWARILILVWLAIWVSTLPLFHVHVPDSTDNWSILQSGGAYTVFSPDLPGEYSHRFHNKQQRHSSHVSKRAVNSPEMGITTLSEPDDRKVKALHVLGAQSIFQATLLQSRDVLASPEKFHQLHLFQFLSSRAPPQIV